MLKKKVYPRSLTLDEYRVQRIIQQREHWLTLKGFVYTLEEIEDIIAMMAPHVGPLGKVCPQCGVIMNGVACSTPAGFMCVTCAHEHFEIIHGYYEGTKRFPRRIAASLKFASIDKNTSYQVLVRSFKTRRTRETAGKYALVYNERLKGFTGQLLGRFLTGLSYLAHVKVFIESV